MTDTDPAPWHDAFSDLSRVVNRLRRLMGDSGASALLAHVAATVRQGKPLRLDGEETDRRK